jgi:hypothetical protein
MTVSGIGAVLGYAVGTFQVLAVDGWQRCAAHRRQLRLLRAELLQLGTYDAQFDWADAGPPDDDQMPRPPVTLLFQSEG